MRRSFRRFLVNLFFGFTTESLLNHQLDVGLAVPVMPFPSNIISKLGILKFPADEVELTELKELIFAAKEKFILCKNGCATAITTAKVVEVEEKALILEGLEVGPVAYHGDSGSLWLIHDCPKDKFKQMVIAIASTIATKLVEDSKGNKVVMNCQNVPIWSWYGWVSNKISEIKKDLSDIKEDTESITAVKSEKVSQTPKKVVEPETKCAEVVQEENVVV
jgi:hypothetical protein